MRIGGGYQKRIEPPPGATQEAKPTPPPLPAAAPAPADAAKPKRFLYTTRRKLSPGEIAKRPKE